MNQEIKKTRWSLKDFEKGLEDAFNPEVEEKQEKPKKRMGRPKKYTAEEIKQHKKDYDLKYQNDKYKNDEEYRTKILERSNLSYRKKIENNLK
jgi:hypothetical protein